MIRSHRIEVGPLGPIIQVSLNVGTVQAKTGIGGQPVTRTGLIDTGATLTAISHAVYRSLRPIVSSSAAIKRPGGTETNVSTCAVRLKFEGHLASNPWFDLDVTVVDPATPGIDVLIGMDLISQVALFYEGVNGTMVVTY